MSTKIRRIAASIDLESLESRRLLAAFGTPWPDARDLSISFPADGVQIDRHQNNLHSSLDQVTDRNEWQELVLRAYQTWAIHTDINVGLRNDYDVRFGAPGLAVNDPRFGEFRIGATPQQGLLASALPFQVAAGTFSGDLILNSNETFTYHDWANDQGPDPASINDGDRDLFSLLLHEVGNTLGLEDNVIPSSIMFGQYTVPKGVLTAVDINSIQTLYGARSDPYESTANDSVSLATVVPTPVGFDPSQDVLRARNSIASATDIDVYQITPITGQDSATIRVQTAGISLLKSRLQVMDANGVLIAQSAAHSVYDNNLEIQLTGLSSHNVIYLRVAADDSNNLYSVGDYDLEVDYRTAAQQASDDTPRDFDQGADLLFADIGLVDQESGANDTTATALDLPAGDSQILDRYESVSSINGSQDVDVWKVTSPNVVTGMLRVHVAGVGLSQPNLNVHLVDASGVGLGASGRLHPDGTWTMEILQPTPNEDYFIRVSVDPNSTVAVGNYIATAEFQTPSTQMNTLVNGTVDHTVDEFLRWTAKKTKVFRFDLAVSGGVAGERVMLTIYDAYTHEIRMVLRSETGANRSALALLQQGDYILRFSVLSDQASSTSTLASTLTYALTCDGLSDDQDNDGDDPDTDNENDEYYYDNMDVGSDDDYEEYLDDYYIYYPDSPYAP